MTNERIFYIAYDICNYMRNREMQNQFEDYEFCIYVTDMADNIRYAIEHNDSSVLKQYYETLNDELNNVCWMDKYADEVKRLICLLDECKDNLYIYKSMI